MSANSLTILLWHGSTVVWSEWHTRTHWGSSLLTTHVTTPLSTQWQTNLNQMLSTTTSLGCISSRWWWQCSPCLLQDCGALSQGHLYFHSAHHLVNSSDPGTQQWIGSSCRRLSALTERKHLVLQTQGSAKLCPLVWELTGCSLEGESWMGLGLYSGKRMRIWRNILLLKSRVLLISFAKQLEKRSGTSC